MSVKEPIALTVLVVEDDLSHGKIVAEVLERSGHRVRLAGSGAEGLRLLASEGPTRRDGPAPAGSRRMTLVARCAGCGERETPQCVVVTGFGTVEGAVKAMRAGALTYLQKPVDLGILRQSVVAAGERIALERANRELRKTLDKTFSFPGIIGESPAMQRILDVMNQVADTDATVLILGESGTGKELVAQALHRSGPRRNNTLSPLNFAELA
jgi:two-component system response regulator HydG